MIITLEEVEDVVHSVKEVRCDKGSRMATVKCGLTVIDDSHRTPDQWTAWHSLVTCPDCLGGTTA